MVDLIKVYLPAVGGEALVTPQQLEKFPDAIPWSEHLNAENKKKAQKRQAARKSKAKPQNVPKKDGAKSEKADSG